LLVRHLRYPIDFRGNGAQLALPPSALPLVCYSRKTPNGAS